MKINVLYQFNEKYAPYAGTSVTSLFENNKNEDITLYICGEDLSGDSKQKFMQLSTKYGQTVIFIEVKELINNMKEWGLPSYRGSYAANYRLFVSYFLHESVERMVYLDADTIVVGSIADLYNIDLGDNAVAMVVDSLGNSFRGREIGLNEGEMYFNSGVILFDILKWRDRQYSEKVQNHICNIRRDYSFPDQDLLNLVVRGDIKALSPKFNFQPIHYVFDYDAYASCYDVEKYYTPEELSAAANSVCIYHSLRFVGEFPWNKNSIHPYKDIFDYYLSLSAWKDYSKRKEKKSLMMRIEKHMYHLLPPKCFLFIFSFFHKRYVKKTPEIPV